MNPKYTPATYFSAFMFVFNLVMIQVFYPINNHNIIFLLPAAVIGGVIGGWLLGLVWNRFKKGQSQN